MATQNPRPQPVSYAVGKLCCLTKELPQTPAFDIVAVHGMQVATCKNDVWLTHILPKGFPGARVLSFRYNTPDVFTTRWDEGFEKSVSKLLDSLISARAPFPAQRPLVLICQGVGGLLVEAALNRIMTEGPRYSQLGVASKAVIFLNTPQNQTYKDHWTPMLIRMAGTSLYTDPQLLWGVERWLQAYASSLQGIASLFKERYPKLRVLAVYNSGSPGLRAGATDELSVAFTTGLKREKMLDLRGYDYISTSKPTNVKDELLKMLTMEVKSVLRLMSKPDTKTTPGTEPHKKTTSGLAGVKGRTVVSRPSSNTTEKREVPGQEQRPSLQRKQVGSGSGVAPTSRKPVPQNVHSSKPPGNSVQPRTVNIHQTQQQAVSIQSTNIISQPNIGPQAGYVPPQANGVPSQGMSPAHGPGIQQPKQNPHPKPTYLPYRPPQGSVPPESMATSRSLSQAQPLRPQQVVPTCFIGQQQQTRQAPPPNPKQKSGFFENLFGSGPKEAKQQQSTRGMPPSQQSQPQHTQQQQQLMPPSQHNRPQQTQQQQQYHQQQRTRGLPLNQQSQPQYGQQHPHHQQQQQPQQQERYPNSIQPGTNQPSLNRAPQYQNSSNSNGSSSRGLPGRPAPGPAPMQSFPPRGSPQHSHQSHTYAGVNAHPQQPMGHTGPQGQRAVPGNITHNTSQQYQQSNYAWNNQQSSTHNNNSSTTNHTTNNVTKIAMAAGGGLAVAGGAAWAMNHYSKKEEEEEEEDDEDEGDVYSFDGDAYDSDNVGALEQNEWTEAYQSDDGAGEEDEDNDEDNNEDEEELDTDEETDSGGDTGSDDGQLDDQYINDEGDYDEVVSDGEESVQFQNEWEGEENYENVSGFDNEGEVEEDDDNGEQVDSEGDGEEDENENEEDGEEEEVEEEEGEDHYGVGDEEDEEEQGYENEDYGEEGYDNLDGGYDENYEYYG
ncbi:hypothetical protein PG989_000950 [Apiospora arundinis]